MPALPNPRRERFASEVAKGQSLRDAYRIAGYSGNPKISSSLRLKKDVDGRINELVAKRQSIDYAATQRAIERLALTKEALAREFLPLATSNMNDDVGLNAEGSPYFDFSNVGREQWAAVKALTIEEFMDGKGERARPVKRIKFQLHEKVGAGMAIAKLFGWIIEKREDVSRLEERLKAMSPEERRQDAEEMYRKARAKLLGYERKQELSGIGEAVDNEGVENER